MIKLHRPPDGITLLHIEAAGKRAWLGMQWLQNHTPFDREDVQAELRTEIEGLPDGCYCFHEAGIRGQPSFDLSTLAAVDRVKAFTEILAKMVAWWRASHPDEPTKMSANERYQYQEGKIWALEHLLGAALKATGICKLQLDELLQQALEGYPGARDPKGPIGKGIRETFRHATSSLGGVVPETTVQELARTLLHGMARHSDSPVVFNVARAMETALGSNDWPELERLACRMRDAIERDVPTD